jgi:hypothetical protein
MTITMTPVVFGRSGVARGTSDDDAQVEHGMAVDAESMVAAAEIRARRRIRRICCVARADGVGVGVSPMTNTNTTTKRRRRKWRRARVGRPPPQFRRE